MVTGRLVVPGGSVISRAHSSQQTLGFPLNLCGGRVRLKTYYGRRLVANRLARVTASSCKWSKRYVFSKTKLPRSKRRNGVRIRLKIKARYGGDRYLRASATRSKVISVR